VTDVYVDATAVSTEAGTAAAGVEAGAPAEAPPAGGWPADAEALRALHHLRAAGVRVVVVEPNGWRAGSELRAAADAVVDAVPDRPNGPAWYLTSDIERCQGSSARLRTVFIGGTPPAGSIRRCDAVARDVQAAAMEILAADAMAPAGTGS
jgi:hypothetical protein